MGVSVPPPGPKSLALVERMSAVIGRSNYLGLYGIALVGGYSVDGDDISFGQMASTMMACPGGMDVASRFAGALGTASGWRILGRHLELTDAAGTLVARFEAR